MAQIELTPGTLIVRIEGADRLWALKSQLDIPLAHVAGAEPAEAEARKWLHGIRLGGVHLPGMISAGTFYEHGQWMFWDVHDPERAIAIALRDEHYSRLVVEVDDPAAAVADRERGRGQFRDGWLMTEMPDRMKAPAISLQGGRRRDHPGTQLRDHRAGQLGHGPAGKPGAGPGDLPGAGGGRAAGPGC